MALSGLTVPITLAATDSVFSFIAIGDGSGNVTWGSTGTLTQSVSSSGSRQNIYMAIDGNQTCYTQYKNFDYRTDTSPPHLTPTNLTGVDRTDTSMTAEALCSDQGSGIKTIHFLCLPQDDAVPTSEAVLAGNNVGVKDSSGYFNFKFENLRANRNYRVYAVLEDNVGNRTEVITSDKLYNTRPSALAGEVTIDNMSPVVGEIITATLNTDNDDLGEISYQWFWRTSDDVETLLVTNNKASFTVSQACVGKKLFCRVNTRNTTTYLYSEKTTAVPKMQQIPLAFASYSTDIQYGTTNRSVTASRGSGGGAMSYSSSSSNPAVATIDSAGKVKTVGVGTFTVTATKAGDNSYEETSITSDAITITPMRINITGLTGIDRQYDGTFVVELSGGTLWGVLPGDDVTPKFPAEGTVEYKMGTGMFIRNIKVPLKGAKADCYTVTSPWGPTVNIRARSVTVEGITVEDKTFDETTSAHSFIYSSGQLKAKLTVCRTFCSEPEPDALFCIGKYA